METIKIKFQTLGEAYQIIENGVVLYYEDLNGNFLFDIPPTGEGSEVVNA